MPRYRLLIEYDGGPFVGWQRQDTGPSVQQALEEAAERLCAGPVRLHAAGRTDSGVHALGMVAHADIAKTLPDGKMADALNAHLRPAPVAVLAADVVPDAFHARFSCVERRYLYRILTRRAGPALDKGRVWWHPRPLDADAMHAAAQVLVGHHDFSSFRAAECQADSPVKTLDALAVARMGEEVHVTARARSFLHHQVRNMVGTLALVGTGKWTVADLRAALAARDRAAAGPTAPAHGLYFVAARYPDTEE
ncbi:tRNA pseudouridine(38-40) synthase TruA [Roseospira goensis]|uniref:tRNA pseudouridine synthase A n=1 Tax=Roseospira goensis TaxID=391922 RepID=A0A7W6WKW1_9PROT|nr:tRNA pseudouridine(38-40) synthase TruA [Roseospira goensis]MBB4285782.1 tRNA pseudouridine38-40 synthase [Roseospira goensis]